MARSGKWTNYLYFRALVKALVVVFDWLMPSRGYSTSAASSPQVNVHPGHTARVLFSRCLVSVG